MESKRIANREGPSMQDAESASSANLPRSLAPRSESSAYAAQHERVLDYLDTAAANVRDNLECLLTFFQGVLVQESLWLHEDWAETRRAEPDPAARLDYDIDAADAMYKLRKACGEQTEMLGRIKRERRKTKAKPRRSTTQNNRPIPKSSAERRPPK